ncbi:hypothetical protein DNTS_018048, partial [Danionella cerebrum]
MEESMSSWSGPDHTPGLSPSNLKGYVVTGLSLPYSGLCPATLLGLVCNPPRSPWTYFRVLGEKKDCLQAEALHLQHEVSHLQCWVVAASEETDEGVQSVHCIFILSCRTIPFPGVISGSRPSAGHALLLSWLFRAALVALQLALAPGETREFNHDYKTVIPSNWPLNLVEMASHKQSFQCFHTIPDETPLQLPSPHDHCSATSLRAQQEPLEDRHCCLCAEHKSAKVMTSGALSNPWNQYQTNLDCTSQRPEEGPDLAEERKLGRSHSHRRSRKIVLVKNSDPSVCRSIVLRRRSLRSLSFFMEEASELMHFLIRKLYTVQGHKIESVQSLLQCPSTVVCVGREPFHPLLMESFTRPSVDKLPHLNTKSDDKTAKKNVNFGLETKRSVIHPRCDGFPNRLNSLPPKHRCDYTHAGENVMDNDIEKRVLVNKDGSLSMRMKVRFRLLHNETLHWSTEVTKSKSTFNESQITSDDACSLTHGSEESCSEADPLCAGDAGEAPKRYLRCYEEPHCRHCCGHCREYDIWKHPPVPPSQQEVRHIRSSSSSASSCRIVSKKASMDSGHTVSSEEYIVEKSTCIQKTFGQQCNTTIEQCTINHCCSQSEISSVSSKAKSPTLVEDKNASIPVPDDEERYNIVSPNPTKDQLNFSQMQEDERPVSVVSTSSQVLASLKEDPDDDDDDEDAFNLSGFKNHKEDMQRIGVGTESCKSAASLCNLSPRPRSKDSSSSKRSRKSTNSEPEIRSEASTSPKALLGTKPCKCGHTKNSSQASEPSEAVHQRSKSSGSTKLPSDLSSDERLNGEITEERSSSAISLKSNKSLKPDVSELLEQDLRASSALSTKSDISKQNEVSDILSEVRTSSAMSFQSNTSMRSRKSETDMDELGERPNVNTEGRPGSSNANLSDLKAFDEESAIKRMTNEDETTDKRKEAVSSRAASSVSLKSDSSLRTKSEISGIEQGEQSLQIPNTSPKKKRHESETGAEEKPAGKRSQSSLSSKSKTSTRSTRSKVDQENNHERASSATHAVDMPLSVTSCKSIASKESENLKVPPGIVQKEECLNEERSQSGMSTRSSLSARSNKSSVSEDVSDEPSDSKVPEEQRASSALSVKSNLSTSSKKSTTPSKEIDDTKETKKEIGSTSVKNSGVIDNKSEGDGSKRSEKPKRFDSSVQLLDFGPKDEDGKREKYQELMSMLKSLWLSDPMDRERSSEEKSKLVIEDLKAKSSSGVDVSSGSTGSGKSSVNDSTQFQINIECDAQNALTKVQEVDETTEAEASKINDTNEEKLQNDTPCSDETIRSNVSPRETPLSSNKSSGNIPTKGDNESDRQEDTSSGSAPVQQRVLLSKRLSQDPDPVWVLNLLNKLEKQFMTHYVDAMAEFKVRWNLDDSEQLDTMICELEDEVHKRIQLSIDRELKKIKGRAGRPRPPNETMSRESTLRMEQRRRRLKVMRNQSIDQQPANSDDENTLTGTDFSDQRSDDDYCPCESCLKKKMASKSVLPAEMLNTAPVMMDFDLRRILQIKKSSSANEKIEEVESCRMEEDSNLENDGAGEKDEESQEISIPKAQEIEETDEMFNDTKTLDHEAPLQDTKPNASDIVNSCKKYSELNEDIANGGIAKCDEQVEVGPSDEDETAEEDEQVEVGQTAEDKTTEDDEQVEVGPSDKDETAEEDEQMEQQKKMNKLKLDNQLKIEQQKKMNKLKLDKLLKMEQQEKMNKLMLDQVMKMKQQKKMNKLKLNKLLKMKQQKTMNKLKTKDETAEEDGTLKGPRIKMKQQKKMNKLKLDKLLKMKQQKTMNKLKLDQVIKMKQQKKMNMLKLDKLLKMKQQKKMNMLKLDRLLKMKQQKKMNKLKLDQVIKMKQQKKMNKLKLDQGIKMKQQKKMNKLKLDQVIKMKQQKKMNKLKLDKLLKMKQQKTMNKLKLDQVIKMKQQKKMNMLKLDKLLKMKQQKKMNKMNDKDETAEDDESLEETTSECKTAKDDPVEEHNGTGNETDEHFHNFEDGDGQNATDSDDAGEIVTAKEHTAKERETVEDETEEIFTGENISGNVSVEKTSNDENSCEESTEPEGENVVSVEDGNAESEQTSDQDRLEEGADHSQSDIEEDVESHDGLITCRIAKEEPFLRNNGDAVMDSIDDKDKESSKENNDRANKCGLGFNLGESAEAGDEADEDSETDEESEDGAYADGEDSETDEHSQVVDFKAEPNNKASDGANKQLESVQEDDEAEDDESQEHARDEAKEGSCVRKDQVKAFKKTEEGKLSDITEDTAEDEDQTNGTIDDSEYSELKSS